MSFTLLLVGAGVLYLFSRPNARLNTGSKPRTNAFASGKAYGMSLYNVNTCNGYVPTKAIGVIGTPKYYVNDLIGVRHAVHLVDHSPAHCDCRKDAPAH